MPEEKEIGQITHYFNGIEVAVIELQDKLVKGDKVRIQGATTDFEQSIDSIQIDRKEIDSAKKGDAVGIKVADRVRQGDKVYKI